MLRAVQRDLREPLRRRLPRAARRLRRRGARSCCASCASAARRSRSCSPTSACPGMTGVELLEAARELYPEGQARAADRLRRHGRGDRRDQPRADRLLPAEAVGPAGGAAVPDARGPARRLAGRRACSPTPRRASSATASRPPRTTRATSSPATASRTSGSTSTATPRRGGCSTSPASARDRLPAVFLRDGDGARGADAARAGRRGSASPTQAGARLLRPGHRRRRPGRPRRRGLRRLRGAAHRARRARGARRPGRPELADRELPRLPERPLGRRPRPPRARPGAPLRRRAADGAARSTALEARGPQRVVRARRRRASSPATACSIATGVAYRRLDAPGVEALDGRGVYYGASLVEAEACADQNVVVVGGANSAGQAAVFLAARPRRVLDPRARRRRSRRSMSHYLIEQIDGDRRTSRCARARRSRRPRATEHLEARARSPARTARRRSTPRAMFVFIGAAPYTDWLGEHVGARRARLRARRAGRRGRRRRTAGRSSATRSCSRPRCRACSWPATCATARSSAWPARSARAR